MNDTQIADKMVRGFAHTDADAPEFANFRLRAILSFSHTDIRNLRGRKCKTFSSFCDEIAAALQFPYYFGENPAAIEDCLTDLDWLPSRNHLILLEDSHLFFSDENDPNDDFGLLVRIFQRTQDYWQSNPSQGWSVRREPRGFKFLLQLPEQFVNRFEHIIGGQGSSTWHVDLGNKQAPVTE